MRQLTPLQKHNILTLYKRNSNDDNFRALADRYNIKGGMRVIQNWYQQWNGTPESLERRKGSGRKSVLTSRQIKDYIETPIRTKNRSHQPVHYSTLLPSIKERSGTNVSLRTVQRIGKMKLHARQKRTQKRTTQERNLISTLTANTNLHS
jgi:hypothetical protein